MADGRVIPHHEVKNRSITDLAHISDRRLLSTRTNNVISSFSDTDINGLAATSTINHHNTYAYSLPCLYITILTILDTTI